MEDDFGFIKSWGILYDHLFTNIFSPFIGLGGGNYASIGAERAADAGLENLMSIVFDKELGGMNSAFLLRYNNLTCTIAEYGIIGTLLFIYILNLILLNIIKYKKYINISSKEKLLISLFISSLSIVLFTDIFTTKGWTMSILLYPLMIIPAYCYNRIRFIEDNKFYLSN